jgi:hypothetical protein
LENYRNSPQFCATYFQSRDYVSILTKNGLGYILGDYFTNSSGRPGLKSKEAGLPDGIFSNRKFQFGVNLGESCNGRCWYIL